MMVRLNEKKIIQTWNMMWIKRKTYIAWYGSVVGGKMKTATRTVKIKKSRVDEQSRKEKCTRSQIKGDKMWQNLRNCDSTEVYVRAFAERKKKKQNIKVENQTCAYFLCVHNARTFFDNFNGKQPQEMWENCIAAHLSRRFFLLFMVLLLGCVRCVWKLTF